MGSNRWANRLIKGRKIRIISIYFFLIAVSTLIGLSLIHKDKRVLTSELRKEKIELMIEMADKTRYNVEEFLGHERLGEERIKRVIRDHLIWLCYINFLWLLLGSITWIVSETSSKRGSCFHGSLKGIILIAMFLEIGLLAFLATSDITGRSDDYKKILFHNDNPINWCTSAQLLLASFTASLIVIMNHLGISSGLRRRGIFLFLILSLGFLIGALDEAFEIHERLGWNYLPRIFSYTGLEGMGEYIDRLFYWKATFILFIFAIGSIIVAYYVAPILMAVKPALFSLVIGIIFQTVAFLCERYFPTSADFPPTSLAPLAYIEEISELLGSFCYLLSMLIFLCQPSDINLEPSASIRL